MDEPEKRLINMPRLYDVFDMPKITSIRARTMLHKKVSVEDIIKHVPHTEKIKTSNKNVAKFGLRRGAYLLFFPSGYVEIYAQDQEVMREVLVAFRNKLSESKLL